MFIDGVYHGDKEFQKDAENLAKFFIKAIAVYQRNRMQQDGKVTVHVIYAAAMFALGVVTKDLPRRERKQVRDYMISKFDDFMREHGA